MSFSLRGLVTRLGFMLLWLIILFGSILKSIAMPFQMHMAGHSQMFLMARVALASFGSLAMAIVLGPLAIRWLQARFRERIGSASLRLNEIQAAKQSTPTMGGLFIVMAIVIATLIFGDLTNRFVQIGLGTAIAFGTLGAVDDWIKSRTRRNGLSVRQKLAAQWALSTLAAVVLYYQQRTMPGGLALTWPFGGQTVWLGAAFILWAAVVLVGTSNAVNLTDGLDGLAGGCTVFAGSAFMAITFLAGQKTMADSMGIPFVAGCGELCVVLGATVGAMLGFLRFNCHPAQVFMGDTGSLPIGALLALAALASRQEVSLVIVGGVFVVETLSVLLQVGWFKLTGQRLIACSPLHNHYLFKGLPEIKIVARFWIGSALLAILGMATLKIR